MFAMLGLGTQEIVLLGILGLFLAVGIVVVLLVVRSATGSSHEMSALEEENRRLRSELDRDRPQAQ
jgi:uncharacterized membrane-anchored protein YhcB (DUF1043 family)